MKKILKLLCPILVACLFCVISPDYAKQVNAYSYGTTTYTITYNANGGIGGPYSQTKNQGQAVWLSYSQPTRTGYTFEGWSTSSYSSYASYRPGAYYNTDANLYLYAVWKPITYTITYNANGGFGGPYSQTKKHGETAWLSYSQPTRTGYTFKGWSTSSYSSYASYQPGAMFTTNANVTLYAVWSKN